MSSVCIWTCPAQHQSADCCSSPVNSWQKHEQVPCSHLASVTVWSTWAVAGGRNRFCWVPQSDWPWWAHCRAGHKGRWQHMKTEPWRSAVPASEPWPYLVADACLAKWPEFRLLSSLPAGGAGVASSVAGGQEPVLSRLGVRGGWCKVTVSFLLPPLNPILYCGRSNAACTSGGWRGTKVFWLSCVMQRVNSCQTCSDAFLIQKLPIRFDTIQPVLVLIRYWSDNHPFSSNSQTHKV